MQDIRRERLFENIMLKTHLLLTGKVQDAPCVFPFYYTSPGGGSWGNYEYCIYKDAGHIPWCSTKTDKKGNHVVERALK